MERQKEIGISIKERLGDTQKTLEAPVWERIQDTLQKEKRRRALFNWSLNSMLILFTIGGFLMITKELDGKKEASAQNKTILTETIEKKNEKNAIITTFDKKDSVIDEKEVTISSANQSSPKEEQKTKTLQESFKKPISKPTKKEIIKSNPQEEVYTHITEESPERQEESPAVRTEKVYYYYNSKDGQEVSSMDKKVIDSTLQANSIKKDSLR